MKRNIDRKLLEWKEKKRRKPLVLRGARQVGKTWCLKRFGQQQFADLVSIDLERHPDWHGIFSKDLSAKKICLELEIVSGKMRFRKRSVKPILLILPNTNHR